MTKKKNHFLICLMVVLMSILTSPYVVLGASANGQVVVPSEISFYEDGQGTTKSSSSSSTPQSSSQPKNSGSTTTKGKGILPQTGEIIKNYGFIGIAILILVVLLFFLRKRRKDDDDEN